MDKRKQLREQYKQREVTGGVCRILNVQNGRYLLMGSDDLRGSRNAFDFSISTGGCVNMLLQRDWKEYGAGAFSFEVLEELVKKPEQTREQFMADVEALRELWAERFDLQKSY